MGTLAHGPISVDFEDRLLTHVQIIVVQRFRRSEPLIVSWLDDLMAGDGRSSMWMTPALPVYFKFIGSRLPRINTQWLRTLNESASSSTGLVLTTEDGKLARAIGPVRIA